MYFEVIGRSKISRLSLSGRRFATLPGVENVTALVVDE
jgi:hypothetical protein